MESESEEDIAIFSGLVNNSSGTVPPGEAGERIRKTKKRKNSCDIKLEKTLHEHKTSYKTKTKENSKIKTSPPKPTSVSLSKKNAIQKDVSSTEESDFSEGSEGASDGELAQSDSDHTGEENGSDASDTSDFDEPISPEKVRKTKLQTEDVGESSADNNEEKNVRLSKMEDDKKMLREKLANMPFLELQKFKEKIGGKTYNEIMFGTSTSMKKGRTQKTPAHELGILHKSKPVELSSKARVPRFTPMLTGKKKKVNRDPRFDDLSGEYNEVHFNKNYDFLSDIRKREKQELLTTLKKEEDDDKKKDIKFLLHRMCGDQLQSSKSDVYRRQILLTKVDPHTVRAKQKTQQDKATRENEKKRIHMQEWKNKERQRIKEGKTPFYLKDAERKKLELADKYKDLQKTGNIDKYLSRKRKKNAAKEKKRLPKNLLKGNV